MRLHEKGWLSLSSGINDLESLRQVINVGRPGQGSVWQTVATEFQQAAKRRSPIRGVPERVTIPGEHYATGAARVSRRMRSLPSLRIAVFLSLSPRRTGSAMPAKKSGGYKDLIVWREAHQLTLEIFRLTDAFPSEQQFVLTTQMRRAALSVSSNIAEGSARKTSADFVHFLHMARGSLAELENQLLVVRHLGFADDIAAELESIARTGRMLTALIQSLTRRHLAQSTKR